MECWQSISKLNYKRFVDHQNFWNLILINFIIAFNYKDIHLHSIFDIGLIFLIIGSIKVTCFMWGMIHDIIDWV